MTVRLRLALTVFLTGLATALAVIVTVALAFQRFEHESTWQRGDNFLARVTQQHDDLLDQHQRNPEEFAAFLRNLLLYEPDSQLYLLAPDGTVLVSTGQVRLPAGFKVALAPVQLAARASAAGNLQQAAYVMGDDPEFMNTDAVVAARALQRSTIRPRPADGAAAGFLYLVCRKPGLPAGRLQLLGASLVSPALVPVVTVILLISALAAWVIVTVTRPLKVLSEEVATAARAGFTSLATVPAPSRGAADDEFNRLRGGFHSLLATLRMQWDELRRLDTFRRESVSNLSHDLRSPLTATVACLETLQARWQAQPDAVERREDQRLLQVALRNTRNAAGMVRSLGDLALLDEPEFKLHLTRLDVGEVLDDIALRFAPRATQAGVRLGFRQEGETPPVAEVDIELFERAVANLLDNALKFTPPGKAIDVVASRHPQGVRVTVADQGAGIPEADLPRLFDRLYQSRDSVAPATSDEGRGLGLAIVKRIAELHRGHVAVASVLGQGTTVTLELPTV